MELVANTNDFISLNTKVEPTYTTDALIDSYHDAMYWFIRKMVGCHEDTQDILQNTWIRVHNKLSTFKGNSSIKTWLFRIAYNESMRLLEKNKKKWDSYDGEENSYLNKVQADVYFDGEEFQFSFHRLLSTLSLEERTIFQFKYFDELKFKEISSITGFNENTIKSKYYKITSYLEEALKEKSI